MDVLLFRLQRKRHSTDNKITDLLLLVNAHIVSR